MHVRDGGRWSVGGAAWLRIAEVVPTLRPLAILARLPFVHPFVEPVYRVIARNRHRISRLLGDDACSATSVKR
jgi:predicted DCC family thiol-disulfide oxidoreductase YuxK